MFVKRCANCGRLNPRNSVVGYSCSVSLCRFRVCSGICFDQGMFRRFENGDSTKQLMGQRPAASYA